MRLTCVGSRLDWLYAGHISVLSYACLNFLVEFIKIFFSHSLVGLNAFRDMLLNYRIEVPLLSDLHIVPIAELID